jgi:FG-GAP-like repeat/Secretion system C-terminal sorting domain
LKHLKGVILFFILAATITSKAQFSFVVDQSIPVQANGQTLSLPWAGGLNSPEFNTMDLNGDQIPDLVLFDRTANQVITFINQNKTYIFAPEYEVYFPSGLDQWILLRDFNCDGKKDIFTSDPFGMRAFVNVTQTGQHLAWREFNPGFPILTIGFNGSINLQVNGTDIPAIDDIDGDGDLDVLDARFVGIGSLEYHKNMSIENTGKCDSMQFLRITQKWGNFEECNCGKYLYDSIETCAVYGRIEHAAGKSSITIDMDGDGDRDLFFTEETCTDLYYLVNEGDRVNAKFTGSTPWPAANPLSLNIFPAPYMEDVDFDGIPDLIVSSNIYTRNSQTINFQQSAWLYKNTGTADLPVFNFVKNNFLQDQMIEVGDDAVPAFTDEDGDGDLDLFIGYYVGPNLVAGVYFYENTGTKDDPAFKLITNDYAGISALGLYNVKPQFADLNADGNVDLVFTATDSVTTLTKLYFIPNKSKGKLDVSGQNVVPVEFTINQPENILVVDVNQDGYKDVLLGTSTGALQYWINNGPAGEVNLALQDPAYLGLGVTTARQSLAMSSADLNADGKEDLVVCDQTGTITCYGNFRDQNAAGQGVQNVLYNPLTQNYQTTSLGGRGWPAVANLFNSDEPVIAVGNILGGMYILRNDGSQELPTDPVIVIYPNPAPKGSSLTVKADRNVYVQFYTMLGQPISDEVFIPANQSYIITPQGLSAGLYIARFTTEGKAFSKKIIIL